MRVRIHRGATEIGGSCVELEAGGSTLILDLGRPLWASRNEEIPLPPAVGLGAPGPKPLALLLSHGHQDHWGLIPQLPSDVPIWTGEGAADVLRAAEFFGSGIDLKEAGHLQNRTEIEFGPFTVTPYLADHSAFDAFSLLIEAGGRQLFYTGDFRGHGRKDQAFQWLLDQPPAGVHVLLMEGTNIRRDSASGESIESETDVEHALVETYKNTTGLVVVLASAQNVDRLVTVYRAALRGDRDLAIDLYTAEIAAATRRETIPQVSPDWTRVFAYLPTRQRVKVKQAGAFDKVRNIRDRRIYDEELLTRPARWVLFGAFQSQIASLIKQGALADGAVVWSLWDGYLSDAGGKRLTKMLAEANVPLVHHHTSGHASLADMRHLVEALNPDRLVPIHTEAPEQFATAFQHPVELHADGEWWDV
ncbi:MAG: MBL fold metallo-hydrolase [Actinomycetia bacterium]|nr:MBL fold metallo-hydrolase [Actinomycetes bacterium]